MFKQARLYQGCFLVLLTSFWGCSGNKSLQSHLSQNRSAIRVVDENQVNTRVGGALIRFAHNQNHQELMPYEWNDLKSPNSIIYLQDFYKTVKTEVTPFRFLLSKKAKSGCKLDGKSDQILTNALVHTLEELKAKVYKATQNKTVDALKSNQPVQSAYTFEGQGNLWICSWKKKRVLIFEVHTQIKKQNSNQALNLQMDLRLKPKHFEGSTRKKRDIQAKKQGLTQITYQIADDLYRCFDSAPTQDKLDSGMTLVNKLKTHKVDCHSK
jgi:hypothetical protein